MDTTMDANTTVNLINKMMKGIYNLGLDDFQKVMSTEVFYHDASEYERSFDKMRGNFFSWWCSLSKNVQAAFVERIMQ